MAFQLASIFVKINADLSGFTNGIKGAEDSLSKFRTNMRMLSRQMVQFGAVLLGIGAGILLFFKKALDSAMEAGDAFGTPTDAIGEFEESMNNLSESLSVFNIILGEETAKVFKPVIDGAKDLVDKFNQLDETTQTGIIDVLIFVGVLTALAGTLLLIGSSIPFLMGGLTGLGVLLGPELTGIITTFLGGAALSLGAVFAVIAVMWIADFANIRKHFDEFIAGIKFAFNGLKTSLEGVWDVISGIFEGNTDKISKGIGKFVTGIVDIFKGLYSSVISGLGGFFIDFWVTILSFLVRINGMWDRAWKGLGVSLLLAINDIGFKMIEPLNSIIQQFVNFINSLVDKANFVSRFLTGKDIMGRVGFGGLGRGNFEAVDTSLRRASSMMQTASRTGEEATIGRLQAAGEAYKASASVVININEPTVMNSEQLNQIADEISDIFSGRIKTSVMVQ
jgi:hypothetical protein